jgi:hypothetical protein
VMLYSLVLFQRFVIGVLVLHQRFRASRDFCFRRRLGSLGLDPRLVTGNGWT